MALAKFGVEYRACGTLKAKMTATRLYKLMTYKVLFSFVICVHFLITFTAAHFPTNFLSRVWWFFFPRKWLLKRTANVLLFSSSDSSVTCFISIDSSPLFCKHSNCSNPFPVQAHLAMNINHGLNLNKKEKGENEMR